MLEWVDPIAYKLLLLVAMTLSLHLMLISLSRPRRYASILFLALNASVALWCGAKLFLIFTPDLEHQLIYFRLMMVGISGAAPAFLCFIMNVERDRPAPGIIFFWIVPVISVVMSATNDIHHLFWIDLGPMTGPIITPSRGPWYWVVVAYSYSLILAGLVISLVKTLKHDTILHRWYGVVFLSALLPVGVSILFVFFFPESQMGDPTPITFAFTSLSLAFANRRLNPFDRIPFAKEALFDALREPILILSRQGIVVSANRAATEVFGEGSLEGARSPEPLDSLLGSVGEDGSSPRGWGMQGAAPIEIGGRLYQAALFPFEPRGFSRAESFLIIMLSDVDELERARRDLAEQRRRADAANKAKGDFLAAMSHELRTPLNAIIGLTDLAVRGKLEDTTREDLHIVLDAARRLLSLVNEILDLSKIEAGRVTLERVNFDPARQIERALASFRHLAAKKGLDLSIAVLPETPRAVLGDPLRFDQIVVNLIGNALKFTEAGFVRVRVGPASSMSPSRAPSPRNGSVGIAVSVEDSGIGIRREALAKVFEDFEQAEAGTARRFGGTGLGLGIARRLARLLGGEIMVESELGKGSIFSFDAYFEPGDPSRIEAEHPEPIAEAERSLSLLVAEDDDVNARVATRFLESAGHRWTRVASGKAALEALQRDRFDAILMDIEMPGMDGYETTRKIRAGEAGIEATRAAILAMTAHAGQDVRRKIDEAGMDGYIAKPVAFAELEAALARVESSSRASSIAEGAETGESAGKKSADLRVALGQLGGDAELLAEIAGIFVGEAPARRAALREAAASGDAEALRLAAHVIRSGAKVLCATALDAAALDVETAAGEGDLAAARARIDGLDREYARLLDELARLQGTALTF